MPKQKGILPIQGTSGNITFYKSGDGYMMRGKGGVDGKRIATDPAFQRTRENGAEFGRAGAAGKVLRNALRNVIQNSSDSRVTGRLTKELMKVVKSDSTNPRGARTISAGDVELLAGFDFNINGKLGATLYAPHTATIDRVAGQLKVDLASFIPANMIAAPSGTTHFKIISAGAAIDFDAETFEVDTQSTDLLPWDSNATAAINLTNAVTANNTHPLILALGVEFYQDVNGTKYSLKNGAFNALQLVEVSGAPV
jgi:hypothetical protein